MGVAGFLRSRGEALHLCISYALARTIAPVDQGEKSAYVNFVPARTRLPASC
jgi:hypothetical protein